MHTVTRDDYFTGPDGLRRDLAFPQDLTQQIVAMSDVLLTRVNYLLARMVEARCCRQAGARRP